MKKGYKETMNKGQFDAEGLPIAGAPPAKVKKETALEAKFKRQANKPVNWSDNLRTARYKYHDFVSMEALYQAFKTRLLNELEK